MSISDSLKHLETEIGFPPFMGAPYGEEAITFSQRHLVVSWLTIKGIDKSSLDKSSLVTLGKMYKIERYFDSVLLNQERDNKKKPYKKLEKYTSDLDADWGLGDKGDAPTPVKSIETETKTIPSTPAPLTSQSFNPNQFRPVIEVIARRIIKENLDSQSINNENFLNQKFNALATDLGTTLAQGIQTKNEDLTTELKKLVEDIIFQSYLNQKIQNQQTPDTLPPEPQARGASNASLIPTLDPNYHFDPYATKVVRSALSMCENLYVYGDTGCGKTSHLEQVCAVMSRGLVRINPHDGITREMFLGGMKLINNETIFIEGALPKSMREGLVLLVDEIGFLPPNLAAILNPIGEKGGKLYIPETNEWISPAPGFCIFATDNTGGKGDRTGNYTGIEVQNTATLDRFAFCLKMDYLPFEKEKEMLEKRFPNLDQSNLKISYSYSTNPQSEIEKMLLLAKDIRLAFSRGELSLTLSTRKLIKFFDQRMNNFTTQEALSNTILSWLDEDDETLVKTMIDRLQITNLTPISITTPITTITGGFTNIEMFTECLKNNNRKKAITIYQHVYPCSTETATKIVETIVININDPSHPSQIDNNPLWQEPCPWRPLIS